MSVKLVTEKSIALVAFREPESPRRRSSLHQRTDAVMLHMKEHSSPHRSPGSPERRSSRHMLDALTEDSPQRSALARRLSRQVLSFNEEHKVAHVSLVEVKQLDITKKVVDVFSKPHSALPSMLPILKKPPTPVKQDNPELLVRKAHFTRGRAPEIMRRELSELITRCHRKFFHYAKANSKMELKEESFAEAFGVFRDLLLNIESKSFLDSYIVRDSQVGINKDSKQQKALESFHVKILALRDALKKIGIDDLQEGESINFWSGREGQQRASDDSSSFSDSDIPFFKFLFDCWGHIKAVELKKESHLTGMLPNLFSAIFASHAKGEVNVYMASKNDPSQTVINIDSAFWSAELYHLINNEKVTKVNLCLHMGKDAQGADKWSAPIDLKSDDKEVVDHKDSIIRISARGTRLEVPMSSIRAAGELWKAKALAHKLPQLA